MSKISQGLLVGMLGFAAHAVSAPLVPELAPTAKYQACFAPGTSMEYIRQVSRRAEIMGFLNSLNAKLRQPGLGELYRYGEIEAYQFDDRWRWTATATNGGGLLRGQPLTITWSIVPDGTALPGYHSDVWADSNLITRMDAVYGVGNDGKGGGTWREHLQYAIDRWGELSGITFVYEPADDGADISSLPGQIGVNGDVRIGGRSFYENTAGLVAFNFYPPIGDMVINTDDVVVGSWLSNVQALRNTIGHELGHGLGINHVCPINGTKLMEPNIHIVFDGPQHDDILAVHRGYGDPHENNNLMTGTSLGTITTISMSNASVDDQSDLDVFSFNADAYSMLDATLTPQGQIYLQGGLNVDGACSSGTPFDSRAVHDLVLEVLDPSGTVMTTVNASAIGESESLVGFVLDFGDGIYRVRARSNSDGVSKTQLYELELTLTAGADRLDLKNDGKIDSFDLAVMMSQWGGGAGSSGDINGDGRVDDADLAVLLNAMGD